MVVAMVAALSSLVGIVVGHMLNNGSEYRRWLRQERYVKCAEFLAIAEELRMLEVAKRTTVELIEKKAQDKIEEVAVEPLLSKVYEVTQASGVFPGSKGQLAAFILANPDEFVSALIESQKEKFGVDDPVELVSERTAQMRKLLVAGQAVEIVSGEDTSSAASRVTSAVIELARGSDSEYRSAVPIYREARSSLVAAVQDELRPDGLRDLTRRWLGAKPSGGPPSDVDAKP